jgi:hypothetical protein
MVSFRKTLQRKTYKLKYELRLWLSAVSAVIVISVGCLGTRPTELKSPIYPTISYATATYLLTYSSACRRSAPAYEEIISRHTELCDRRIAKQQT